MKNPERFFQFFSEISHGPGFFKKLFWSGALIVILCGTRGLVLLHLSDGTTHQKKSFFPLFTQILPEDSLQLDVIFSSLLTLRCSCL